MKLLKEPRDVDFMIQSKPWNDLELKEFSLLLIKLKAKNAKTSAKETKAR